MHTIKSSASKRGSPSRRRGTRETRESRAGRETLQSAHRTPHPIEVVNRQRLYPIDRDAVARLARQVLDRIGRTEATASVSFIRDGAMRRLNRDWRGIDAPTDVLSFAYQEADDDEARFDSAGQLGDVIISVETAARYAQKLGLDFAAEIRILVIHGTLHLAGYDHETDNGEMNRLERRLRKELPEW